jgi:exosortase
MIPTLPNMNDAHVPVHPDRSSSDSDGSTGSAGTTHLVFRTRTALFCAYCAAVAATRVDVLRDLINLSRHDMTASHLVLIAPITVGLLYEARRSIFASVRWSWGAGTVVVMAAGMLMLATDTHVVAGNGGGLTLAVAAVVASWIAGFVLFYGVSAARTALFPLLFLGFMVPIPPSILDGVTAVLKHGSAATVDALFTIVGTPHYRDQFVFSLPTVTIEIADECSGIRSTIALLLTSLLAGHLFLPHTWQKFVLAAVIVPITIFKNAVRIVSLCLLAIHYNPGFLAGRLHHEGGIVFYVLGLALLAPLFSLLRRLGRSDADAIEPRPLVAGQPMCL